MVPHLPPCGSLARRLAFGSRPSCTSRPLLVAYFVGPCFEYRAHGNCGNYNKKSRGRHDDLDFVIGILSGQYT